MIAMYKDLLSRLRPHYWNKEIQHKLYVQLEFGKYAQSKDTKGKYLIQLVAKAKHMGAEVVNKLAHHFSRGIHVAAITQSLK